MTALAYTWNLCSSASARTVMEGTVHYWRRYKVCNCLRCAAWRRRWRSWAARIAPGEGRVCARRMWWTKKQKLFQKTNQKQPVCCTRRRIVHVFFFVVLTSHFKLEQEQKSNNSSLACGGYVDAGKRRLEVYIKMGYEYNATWSSANGCICLSWLGTMREAQWAVPTLECQHPRCLRRPFACATGRLSAACIALRCIALRCISVHRTCTSVNLYVSCLPPSSKNKSYCETAFFGVQRALVRKGKLKLMRSEGAHPKWMEVMDFIRGIQPL